MLLTALAVLTFTWPTVNDRIEYAGTDSASVVCEAGDPLTDLAGAHVYWYPLKGGDWMWIRDKAGRGMEGKADTLNVTLEGSYCLGTFDIWGNTDPCRSNIAHVYNTPTGVDPQPVDEPRVVEKHTFNVMGQLIRGEPEASGVYLDRIHLSNGVVYTRKWVKLK